MPTAPAAGPVGPPPQEAPPQAVKAAPPQAVKAARRRDPNAGYARDAVALGCPMDRPLAGSKNWR